MTDAAPPKVAGYRRLTAREIELVNGSKRTEEELLRTIDDMLAHGTADPRWAAIARTGFEQAFMALNRSIFRPERIALPGDGSEG